MTLPMKTAAAETASLLHTASSVCCCACASSHDESSRLHPGHSLVPAGELRAQAPADDLTWTLLARHASCPFIGLTRALIGPRDTTTGVCCSPTLEAVISALSRCLPLQRGCSLINCYQDTLHAAVALYDAPTTQVEFSITSPQLTMTCVSTTAAVLALWGCFDMLVCSVPLSTIVACRRESGYGRLSGEAHASTEPRQARVLSIASPLQWLHP
jgi:hypothetical protein